VKSIIFCFSGTGNSLNAAKIIAARLEICEIVSMGKPYAISKGYERIGFVFPSYASSMPKPVRAFIKSLDLNENMGAYYFTVATCGLQGGNCVNHVKRLLREKGVSLAYGKSIRMVANAITGYGMPKNTDRITAKTNAKLATIAGEITNKTITTIPKTKPFWELIYKKMADSFDDCSEKYNVSNDCTGCGMCVKLCPVENVQIVDGKPHFDKKCVGCVACIQWCPKTAINYKDKTQGKRRYHHPNIQLNEMADFNER
jgi:ferredoxin/flavodoxin